MIDQQRLINYADADALARDPSGMEFTHIQPGVFAQLHDSRGIEPGGELLGPAGLGIKIGMKQVGQMILKIQAAYVIAAKIDLPRVHSRLRVVAGERGQFAALKIRSRRTTHDFQTALGRGARAVN